MKKFEKNAISNIIRSIWSMISIYLFIPIYISMLGEESYGLVSFYATLQATMNIFGLGLSNSLRREFACECDNISEGNLRKFKLLRTIEILYSMIAIVIVFLCFIGSSAISTKWLNFEALTIEIVNATIVLMGISIAINLLNSLWLGCLYGLDRQVLANGLCMTWSLAKAFFSILLMVAIKNNIILFYLGQIIADIIYAGALRLSIMKELKCNVPLQWSFRDLPILKSIWKYTTGVFVISIIAMITQQFDKMLISKMFSLIELGAYNTATALSSITNVVPAAVNVAVFTMLTAAITSGRTDDTVKIYRRVNKSVILFTVCLGSFVAVFAAPLISVWTRSELYVSVLGNATALVVLSKVLLSLQQIPYAMALANGNTSINVKLGVIFLPITIVVTYFFINKYGLLGAGIASFGIMLVQTVIFIIIVNRKYVKESYVKLLILDVFIPFISCLIVAKASYYFITKITENSFLISAIGCIVGLICLVILFLFYIKKNKLYYK